MASPVKTILRFGILSIGIGIIAVSAVFLMIVRDLPDPTRISERPVAESTKIYDRTGTVLLYEIHGEEKRTVIPFSDIPTSIKNATLAAEDANFYSHGGIDIKGIFRALYVDIRTQNISQGGSTITQQLVKNTLVGKERTLDRKIKEAVLAVLLETQYSKDDILGLYLNQIPYGSNAYGVEAAAETFFGKSAKQLTIAESALLASLPKAPSYYSPYGSRLKEITKRKDSILERMQKLGFISDEEYQAALKEKLAFKGPQKNILAPHFVFYVKDILLNSYDETTIENGGLKITTTLDWELQKKAEDIINNAAEKNERDLGAKNAALVAIDPKTGQILAMVGSRDYWEEKNDGNFNVATALRQPGSAFKPFAYLTALQKGYTPETVLFDVPTEFNPLCTSDFKPNPGMTEKDCYHPQNYDETFRGPVTMRQSLQQSLNVPSVKILYLAGIEDTIKTAEALGITSLKDRSRFGLSLVLGGGEVSLLELVSAYGVFAEDGILNPKTPILKIEDSKGTILSEYTPQSTPVADTESVRYLNSILTDNESRVPVFVRENSLYFPDRMVAAKTGTTQEKRDAWTIGFTPSLVAGVWVGNNDNTPMKQNTAGVLIAAPLWKKFMQSTLGTTTPETFTPPSTREVSKPILKGLWQGGSTVTIDRVSRRLATDLTPKDFIEEIAVGEPHSILFWVQKTDPTGAPPSQPMDDPQFTHWEEAVQKWLRETNYTRPFSLILPGTDNIHTEENKPVILLQETDILPAQKELSLSITSAFPIQEVLVRLDNLSLPVKQSGTHAYSALLPGTLDAGFHSIMVFARDTYGNKQTLEKEIVIMNNAAR